MILQGEVLIKISDKSIPGLVLPENVYKIKKKLGCILVENHTSEPMVLKRGQTVGYGTSCVVTQEDQTPAGHSDAMQCVTGKNNDTGTHIEGTSVEDAEKAGWKSDNVQSVVNRQSYKTKKCQFIRESFQLDTNKILNADTKLKEVVIELFLDHFEVLAMHPSQYGETEVLEMKIDLVPGEKPYKSRVRPLNPD